MQCLSWGEGLLNTTPVLGQHYAKTKWGGGVGMGVHSSIHFFLFCQAVVQKTAVTCATCWAPDEYENISNDDKPTE